MREETKKTLEQAVLIPVLRAGSIQTGHALVDAMMAGGVTVVEVTMTVPNALTLLRELKQRHGGRLLLGSGTVTDAAQAEATIDAGAKTKELGRISIPGALTPTEVITAWRAGADYVKIFPCSAMGGASYLKSLLAPFPELKLIPTGGVTLQTAADFLKAGARALGVGTDLVNTPAIAEGRPEIVTNAARAYLEVIRAARSQ
jgi:2-dehydro-3-deoxyphosphogluconate aldolase / (4S)-4-hydroxy-2-oxoglutarate aldolase